ncbi:hypothetical protein [Pseudonocardia sp. GCM10023141]|uniref:hypothetical protein n=1 Tax=Pseudonocardia sp. GCM10023141 TaxID=3252653 RepID=UPI00360A8BF9
METIGFTAVMCTAPGCGMRSDLSVAGHVLNTVRDVVREGSHGVLVCTGCLLGATTCRLRPMAPVVLVQPCDADRRPSAPLVRVGPLRTSADVAALGDWLRVGTLDAASLPGHLLDVQRGIAAASRN